MKGRCTGLQRSKCWLYHLTFLSQNVVRIFHMSRTELVGIPIVIFTIPPATLPCWSCRPCSIMTLGRTTRKNYNSHLTLTWTGKWLTIQLFLLFKLVRNYWWLITPIMYIIARPFFVTFCFWPITLDQRINAKMTMLMRNLSDTVLQSHLYDFVSFRPEAFLVSHDCHLSAQLSLGCHESF